jgi:glycosyltransferase involved in cell wall biosynthesis
MGAPSRKALGQLWGKRRPDLVHIATEGPLGWSALHTAMKLKLPVCSDFRTNFHAYSRHYGIGWLQRPIVAYLRKFHNRCAYTMVPTDALRQELVRSGFERLVVVPRGVDTTLFDPAKRCTTQRAQWGADERSLVALCVGRLAPEKNLGQLIAAFRAMRRVRPDTRLVLVGDGPARATLQAELPDAVFAGTQHGEDLARHYASADVFIFPSMTETFGNVTVEALASGLPVLAYDHAAAGQLVRSGDNGFLAPLGDGAEFVHQALRFVAQPDATTRMGPRARETACTTGWGRAVDQVESVFHATLASAGQSRLAGTHTTVIARAA